jgi:ABC-type multidrug transport system fused ATPase/permease subunit
MDIAPRTMVALVGPSGAGKTTLAQLIPRFHDPSAGEVLVDDHDLRQLDLTHYRRSVGYVPQEVFLFDRSIADNIRLGRPDATDEQMLEAARAANALAFIEETESGFDTIIGERGVRLSGGQRQRLAIAREILRDPAILILDEATSSLDSESESLIQEALTVLFRGRTSFVIAHRLSTVIRADVIMVMDQGRIVEQGTHDSLLAENGLYARLFRSQFKSSVRDA